MPSIHGARTVRRGLQAPAGAWCLVVLTSQTDFAGTVCLGQVCVSHTNRALLAPTAGDQQRHVSIVWGETGGI
jgi:hypothetical protein